MELIKQCRIIRPEFPDGKTPGEFHINGRFFCYVLEDKVRPQGEYIPKETAIDYGTFELVMTFSNRFKVVMPLLLNVQNANPPILFHGVDISNCGIRLHGGNDAEDTEGCPLLGIQKKPFGNCKNINIEFRDMLKASLRVGKVFLEIGKLDTKGKFYIPTIW